MWGGWQEVADTDCSTTFKHVGSELRNQLTVKLFFLLTCTPFCGVNKLDMPRPSCLVATLPTSAALAALAAASVDGSSCIPAPPGHVKLRGTMLAATSAGSPLGNAARTYLGKSWGVQSYKFSFNFHFGGRGRGPRKPSVNKVDERGFLQATIRGNTKVYTLTEVQAQKRTGRSFKCQPRHQCVYK